MKLKNLNCLIDLIILIIFLIVGVTGLIIFPNLIKNFGLNINNLPKVQLYKYHHWFGFLLIIATAIHIGGYWKLLKLAKKKFISDLKELKIGRVDIKNNINHLISILSFLSYFLLFFTGIIKFPGFLSIIGLSSLLVHLNIISFVHDYSGFFAVILTIFHILFYLKKIQ